MTNNSIVLHRHGKKRLILDETGDDAFIIVETFRTSDPSSWPASAKNDKGQLTIRTEERKVGIVEAFEFIYHSELVRRNQLSSDHADLRNLYDRIAELARKGAAL